MQVVCMSLDSSTEETVHFRLMVKLFASINRLFWGHNRCQRLAVADPATAYTQKEINKMRQNNTLSLFYYKVSPQIVKFDTQREQNSFLIQFIRNLFLLVP
jgi:hypothetical protein